MSGAEGVGQPFVWAVVRLVEEEVPQVLLGSAVEVEQVVPLVGARCPRLDKAGISTFPWGFAFAVG